MVLIALMTTFMVVRHTRQNEETGRAEMVGAGAVGRYAMVAAALCLAVLADVVFGGLSLVVAARVRPAGVRRAAVRGRAGARRASRSPGWPRSPRRSPRARGRRTGSRPRSSGLSFLLRAVGDATGEVVRERAVRRECLAVVPVPDRAGRSRCGRSATNKAVVPGAVGCSGRGAVVPHRGAGGAPRHRHRHAAGAARAGAGAPLAAAARSGSRGGCSAASLPRLGRRLLILGVSFGAVGDEVDDLVSGNEDLAEVIEQLGGTGNLVEGYLSAILGIGGLVACRLRDPGAAADADGGGGRHAGAGARHGGESHPLAGRARRCARLLGLVALALLYGGSLGFAYGLASGDVAGETVTPSGRRWCGCRPRS